MALLHATLLFLVLMSGVVFFAYSRQIRAAERDRVIGRRLGCVAAQPFESTGGAFARWQHPLRETLATALAQAGYDLTPASFALIVTAIFVTAMAVTAFWLDFAIALVCSAGAAAIPIVVLRTRRRRRLEDFGGQLPYVLDLLASSLESGHSILRGLQISAQDVPEPLGGEIRLVVDQVRVGMPLPIALESMHRRMPVDEVGFLTSAVRVQNDTGSSLAEILRHVSASVRTRRRLDDQVRALTAQARASAVIVTILPGVILGALTLIRPDYAHPLFYSPLGIRLLETALVFDALALIAMRRIARVDY